MTLTSLEISNLSKRFGGVRALQGVDLAIASGETLGLIGPNGSGKTTLINCLSGVIRPDEGSVRVDGQDITGWSRPRRARFGVVRTYQNLRLFPDMTVAENIAVGLMRAGKRTARQRDRAVIEAIEAHGLADISRTRVRGLAYGQQRRVEIARALVAPPLVLLLDEPAAGLGEADTADLAASLANVRRQHRSIVVLIDHDVEFVTSTSDRVAVLHEGRVVRQGSPAEIRQDPFVSEIYLGSSDPVASAAGADTPAGA